MLFVPQDGRTDGRAGIRSLESEQEIEVMNVFFALGKGDATAVGVHDFVQVPMTPLCR
jgi:hypothetical protein